MSNEQAARTAAMERLAPFLGEWAMEVEFPGSPPASGGARTVFEWLLGGAYMAQRSEIPHPDAPDSLSVIEFDAARDAYTQHYFDSRGVTRIYAMTFTDGQWTLMRERADFSELSFSQRFVGKFSDDGNTIAGRWETGGEGQDWKLDFELTYTRLR